MPRRGASRARASCSDTVTVTGTENLMMAATLARGPHRAGERRARAGSRRPRRLPDRDGREHHGRRHRHDRDRGARAARRLRAPRAAGPHRGRNLPGRRRHHRRARARHRDRARAPRRGDRETARSRREVGVGADWVEVDMQGRPPRRRPAHGAAPGLPDRHAGAVRGARRRRRRRRRRSSRRSSRTASCTCWSCADWAPTSASRDTPP